MPVTGYLRGHPIVYEDGEWRYQDTGEPTLAGWKDRSCGLCGEGQMDEGYDPCLGGLPGVRNACCGHGNAEEAYVQFADRSDVRGRDALDLMRELRVRSDPPPRTEMPE